jgi:hypothetical protein
MQTGIVPLYSGSDQTGIRDWRIWVLAVVGIVTATLAFRVIGADVAVFDIHVFALLIVIFVDGVIVFVVS